MSLTVSARQGVLTKTSNSLSNLIKESEELVRTQLELSHDGIQSESHVDQLRTRITRSIRNLQYEKEKVESEMYNYCTAADNLDADTPALEDIRKKVESRTQTTLALLERAERQISKLRNTLDTLERTHVTTNKHSDPPATSLAPIPIRKFSGDLREWEAFWGAFNHSVHSRQMDDYSKMHYLMDFLQGDAKDYVKEYEICEEAYPVVISRLKKRFGDKDALVDHSLHRLLTMEAQSESLEDQQRLCETLHSILMQLSKKGEIIDTRALQKIVIEKFATDIQRHVQQEGRHRPQHMTTEELFTVIEEFIREEIKLKIQEERRAILERQPRNEETTYTSRPRRPCFYCNKVEHSSTDCTSISTYKETVQVIKDRKLCFNCGSASHELTECRGGPCRTCKKHGHHASICRHQPQPTVSRPQLRENTPKRKEKPSTKSHGDKKTTSVSINTILSNDTKQEDTFVFHANSKEKQSCEDFRTLKASDIHSENRPLQKQLKELPLQKSLEQEVHTTYQTHSEPEEEAHMVHHTHSEQETRLHESQRPNVYEQEVQETNEEAENEDGMVTASLTSQQNEPSLRQEEPILPQNQPVSHDIVLRVVGDTSFARTRNQKGAITNRTTSYARWQRAMHKRSVNFEKHPTSKVLRRDVLATEELENLHAKANILNSPLSERSKPLDHPQTGKPDE